MKAPLREVAAAYGAAATAWRSGPDEVYERLARALLAAAPVPLRGARVLDLGAGTGAASRAGRDAGAALVVAVDLAERMLAQGTGWTASLVADGARLPFRDGAFDLVVAACCLSHCLDPGQVLRECRRSAGAVLASAFPAGWTHPAKDAVDEIAAAYGYSPPEWYVRVKAVGERRVDDPEALRQLATEAGFRWVSVTASTVRTEVASAAQLARWRLGMAHMAPFVAALPPLQRAGLEGAAEAALASAPPLAVPLLVLSAT